MLFPSSRALIKLLRERRAINTRPRKRTRAHARLRAHSYTCRRAETGGHACDVVGGPPGTVARYPTLRHRPAHALSATACSGRLQTRPVGRLPDPSSLAPPRAAGSKSSSPPPRASVVPAAVVAAAAGRIGMSPRSRPRSPSPATAAAAAAAAETTTLCPSPRVLAGCPYTHAHT